MNKGKNSRLKSTPGPKIDQMLSPQPRANEANEANTDQASTSVEQPSEPKTDSPVINEIRYMNRDLQDRIQQVGADVITIKNNLDSLKSDVVNLGNRIGETENRVSQLEDDNVTLTDVTTELKNKVAQLEARIQYQENYSRRNNLRIKGVPEHSEKERSVSECVMEMLRCLFPNSEDINQIVIERAHRVPTVLKEDRRDTPFGPRHILVRFLRFADREKIRLKARDLGTFRWNGSKVDFFPDFTKDVQDKRNKFTEVRRLCRVKGLKYTMQYPAVFWVTIGGERLRFEDAAAAKRSVDRYQAPDEGE